MKQELKDLHKIVEKAAEKILGDGNVARTVVKLRSPVLLERGFKSRFTSGHNKVSLEIIEDSKILSFSFSCAVLDGASARMKSNGSVWKDNYVELVAFPPEILKKIIENAGEGCCIEREKA